MTQRTIELVEELQRLKPGSPVLHRFRDIVDGIEWWNSITPDLRSEYLLAARSSTTPNPSAADAWEACKRRRAFASLTASVAALIKRGECDA